MAFSRFYRNLLIRQILVFATFAMMIVSIIHFKWIWVSVVLAGVLVVLMIYLMMYHRFYQRSVESMLTGLMQRDFSMKYNFSKKGKVEKELESQLNATVELFRKMSEERDTQSLYLKNLVENLGVGIISFDDEGKVDLCNPAALRLLERPFIQQKSGLERIYPQLVRQIEEAREGESFVVHLDTTRSVLLKVTHLTLLQRQYTIVSLENIRKELDQNEEDAWQRLIRVLTHEIMNSITPIVSLSTAAGQLYHGVQAGTASKEDEADIVRSFETISRRGDGLIQFVRAYRNVTSLAEVKLDDIRMNEIVGEVKILLQKELAEKNIALSVEKKEVPLISGDKDLISQVLINLVKNASEAYLQDNEGEIVIEIKPLVNQLQLVIRDNGEGMDEEQLQNALVPFYTTKKEGSGIGLSLSRQLMKSMGGQLTVSSQKGKGTEITLLFNKV